MRFDRGELTKHHEGDASGSSQMLADRDAVVRSQRLRNETLSYHTDG